MGIRSSGIVCSPIPIVIITNGSIHGRETSIINRKVQSVHIFATETSLAMVVDVYSRFGVRCTVPSIIVTGSNIICSIFLWADSQV